MLSIERTLVAALVVLVVAAGGRVHAQSCTGFGDGPGGLDDHTDCCDIAHSDNQSACTSASNYDAGQQLKPPSEMDCNSVAMCSHQSINCYRICPQTCAALLAEAGICVEKMGGFTTPTGGLAQCCPSQAVADVDDCAGDPCGATAAGTCSDTGADSYDCACNSGYTFTGGTCAEIFPCDDSEGNDCDTNAACNHVEPGQHTCSCNVGYSGDGTECTDTNGCADSPCFDGVTCTDVPAPTEGFSCGACPSGYTGDGETCDSTTCTVNEYVSAHTCVACDAGKIVESGESEASGADTSCAAEICSENTAVTNHTCVTCPAGKSKPGGIDNASGPDTTCNEPAVPLPAREPATTDDEAIDFEFGGNYYIITVGTIFFLVVGSILCCAIIVTRKKRGKGDEYMEADDVVTNPYDHTRDSQRDSTI